MRKATLFALLLAACVGESPTPPDASFAQVPARYIVSLERGTRPGVFVTGEGITARFLFDAVGMFSADMVPERAEALRRNPRVRSVQLDGMVSLPPNERNGVRIAGVANTWGTDRIDARLGLDGLYSPPGSGQGIPVYVFDTGVRCTHVELAGRCLLGFDVFGGNAVDDQGHGTHVAGTVAGATYGVAPGATVISVKVLNNTGQGSWEGLIAGMDWVLPQPRGVLNMSLIGPDEQFAVTDAIGRVTDAGHVVVVAAGNNATDACGWSPSGVPDAFSTGATNDQDFRASFSNYGPCVDLFAPGVSVLSSYFTSDNATAVLQGTSMASPHAAGAAAIVMQRNPSLTARQIMQRMKDVATQEVVQNAVPGTTTNLLYVGEDAQPPRPPNQLPVIEWTHSCQDLLCEFDASVIDPDPDGSIVVCSWSWGDGIGQTCTHHVFHAYAAPGVYSVTFEAIDNRTGRSTLTKQVTVGTVTPPPPPPPPPASITLTVTVTNNKGNKTAHLAWTGASGDTVEVYRNGQRAASPPNSGVWSESFKGKVPSYRVCEAGGSVCSNVVAL